MSGINSLEYRLEQFIATFYESHGREIGGQRSDVQLLRDEQLARQIAREFGKELRQPCKT